MLSGQCVYTLWPVCISTLNSMEVTIPMKYTVEDVLRIADALASPDDWGVPAVYPSVLRDVLTESAKHGMTADQIVEEFTTGIGGVWLAAAARHEADHD